MLIGITFATNYYSMKKNFLFFFFTCYFTFLNSQTINKYTVGNGPKDFVIDSFSKSEPRLIIACRERRDKLKRKISYFYSLNIQSKQPAKMVRLNEPEKFSLSIIGIDIESIDGNTFLYATSHYKNDYKVVKYKVVADSLFYVKHYTNDLFSRLNDISVRNGNMMLSNGDIINGSIVFCDSIGNCKTIVDKVKYPNGVLWENDSTLYYTSSLENKLVKTNICKNGTIQLVKLAKIKAANNIQKNGNNLYITGSSSIFKLICHMRNSNIKSPSMVYEYNTKNKNLKEIYGNSGYLISAASSAVMWDNKLFISQIFDDFIVELEYSKASVTSANTSQRP